jgi:hypothetical protein
MVLKKFWMVPDGWRHQNNPVGKDFGGKESKTYVPANIDLVLTKRIE